MGPPGQKPLQVTTLYTYASSTLAGSTMSRSYRKTPVFGNTTARSEKFEKRKLNKKLRRAPLYQAQNPKRTESNWFWGKDGKGWLNQKSAWHEYSDAEWKKLLLK